MDLNKLKNHT